MSEITICITSFNRYELLEECIDTFLKINTYPINKWIISEDSGNEKMLAKIKNKYSSLFNTILFSNKVGQCESIDNMYSLVDTKYILHLEDDYTFSGNPNFLSEAIEILENNLDITRVGITHSCPKEWMDIKENGTFNIMKNNILDFWCGFSFTPGLIKKSDYSRIFPNGYNEYQSEGGCNIAAKPYNYKSSILKNGVCFTTGNGKTTFK